MGRLGRSFEYRRAEVQDGAPRPAQRAADSQTPTCLIDRQQESRLRKAPMQRLGLDCQGIVSVSAHRLRRRE